MSTAAERIVDMMQKKGFNQRELAEASGLTEVSISRYCTGSRIPRRQSLIKLAKALHVTTDYILGIDDTSDNETDFHMIYYMLKKNIEILSKQQKDELIKLILDIK